MSIRHLAIATAVLAPALAQAPLALAAEGASLRFEFPLLSYTSVAGTESPEEGDDTKTDVTSMETAEADSIEVRGSYKSFNLYLVPFGDSPDTTVRLGYMLSKQLELGGLIGINNSKIEQDKTTIDKTDNTFGVFGTFYAQINSRAGLEASLQIAQNTEKDTSKTEDETTGTETESKTEETSTNIVLAATFVVSIADNFEYLGGLSYAKYNSKNKENDADSDNDASGFRLQLASVRYTLD